MILTTFLYLCTVFLFPHLLFCFDFCNSQPYSFICLFCFQVWNNCVVPWCSHSCSYVILFLGALIFAPLSSCSCPFTFLLLLLCAFVFHSLFFVLVLHSFLLLPMVRVEGVFQNLSSFQMTTPPLVSFHFTLFFFYFKCYMLFCSSVPCLLFKCLDVCCYVMSIILLIL